LRGDNIGFEKGWVPLYSLVLQIAKTARTLVCADQSTETEMLNLQILVHLTSHEGMVTCTQNGSIPQVIPRRRVTELAGS
jgi:hypothetical protein